MEYNFLEGSEIDNTAELLEDGVLLEQFRCEKTDIENMEISQLYGTPIEDAKVWSQSNSDCSDGLLCEKYIAELLKKNCISEDNPFLYTNKYAEYDIDYGYTRDGIGKVLESLGLDVSREYDLSVKDICESLDNNEKVICEVSSISMYYPEATDLPGLSADHFVQVIGIDKTNPENETVIVNDPFESEGGTIIKMEVFLSAWEKSNCYAVFAK